MGLFGKDGLLGKDFGSTTSPEDQALIDAITKRMVEQVRAGQKPWKVTPPPGVTSARSRELLTGTDIHKTLRAEWEKAQKADPRAGVTPYDGRNPALPPPPRW